MTMTDLHRDDLRRLMDKVTRRPDGCWEWTAGQDGRGYGAFWLNGRMQKAHRAAYLLTHGDIPNEDLDHLCRNTLCVNPDHLDPVTHRENLLRGDSFWRNLEACSQGHPFTKENTYEHGGRRNCRQCHADRCRRYRNRKKEAAYA